jgi:lambda repressor-like predicted transcriptional regulator
MKPEEIKNELAKRMGEVIASLPEEQQANPEAIEAALAKDEKYSNLIAQLKIPE